MRGERTPRQAERSLKRGWQKYICNKCRRNNKRRHGEGEIPEGVAALAKEIATQVPGVQLPDEERRRREKRN